MLPALSVPLIAPAVFFVEVDVAESGHEFGKAAGQGDELDAFVRREGSEGAGLPLVLLRLQAREADGAFLGQADQDLPLVVG